MRALPAVSLLAVLAASGCQCGPAGRCEGSVGGVDVAGPLHRKSEYHTLYRATGKRAEDQTVLTLACEKGGFEVSGRTRRITAIPTGLVPLPACDAGSAPPDGGSPDAGAADAGALCAFGPVREWTLVGPPSAPRLASGTLEAAIELLAGDIKGEAVMELEDGSRVRVVFDLQHAEHLDEDKPPRSSRSGSHDWDDWD